MRQVVSSTVLLGSLLLGTAQAQPFPFQDHDYDFQAMCTFVELLKGFTLPSLKNGSHTDPHFHFLRNVSDVTNDQGEKETWMLYHYANGGISAKVAQDGAGASFSDVMTRTEGLMRRIITAVLLGSLCFGVAQAQSNINGGDAKQVGDTIVTHLGNHTLYIPKGYVSSIMGFAGTVEIRALLPCLLPATPENAAELRAPLEGNGFGRILTADLTAYSDMPHRVGQTLLDERIKLSAFAKSGQEYSKFTATYDPKHRDPSIGPHPVPNSKFVVYDDALLGRDIFVLPGSDPQLVLDCTRWDKFVVSPECVSVERAPGDLHVKYNYSRSFVENGESAAIDSRLQHLLASFLTPAPISTTKQACE